MMAEDDVNAPPYTVSDRAMQCMVDIAAALERYRIVMEGPNGVRLRKINHIRGSEGRQCNIRLRSVKESTISRMIM